MPLRWTRKARSRRRSSIRIAARPFHNLPLVLDRTTLSLTTDLARPQPTQSAPGQHAVEPGDAKRLPRCEPVAAAAAIIGPIPALLPILLHLAPDTLLLVDSPSLRNLIVGPGDKAELLEVAEVLVAQAPQRQADEVGLAGRVLGPVRQRRAAEAAKVALRRLLGRVRVSPADGAAALVVEEGKGAALVPRQRHPEKRGQRAGLEDSCVGCANRCVNN